MRPVKNEANLQKIDQLAYEDLRPEFTKEVDKLMARIGRTNTPKTVNGQELTCDMFLALALEYVEAFNDPDITPNVTSALERVRFNQAHKLNDMVFAEFKDNFERGLQVENMDLPLTEELFDKVARRAVKKARNDFMKQIAYFLSFKEVLGEYKKLEERMSDNIEKKRQENYSQSYHYTCQGYKESLNQALQVDQNEEDPTSQVLVNLQNLLSNFEKQAQSAASEDFFHDSLLTSEVQ